MNKFKLNEHKTEFFVASSKNNINYIYSLNVCRTIIKPSEAVRNLGVIFDSAMSMTSHISSISRSLNYHLKDIGRIHSYIDNDTCHHTVRSLVITRIDYYCNSLLSGNLLKTLKIAKIQNRAIRLVFKVNQREHTTPLLKE